MNLIDKNKCSIIEGQLRTKELKKYLKSLDCEFTVWISEDATGINQKVEYHPATNQLIGLNLPINEKTGMPVSFSFLAHTADVMKTHAQKPLATLVYVVLALPIKPGAPPFVLQLFGIIQRWEFIIQDLRKYVILHATVFILLIININLNIQARNQRSWVFV